MAINLMFIDFIVPIARIRELYPGGWESCLYDHRRSLGGSVYFDERLFHAGAMDPEAGERLVERWSALGFVAQEVVDGKGVWKDFCVLESLLAPEKAPGWLSVDLEGRAAHLAGTQPGPVAGRRLVHERRRTREAEAAFKRSCRRMRWAAVLLYLVKGSRPLSERLNQWLLREQLWEQAKSRC